MQATCRPGRQGAPVQLGYCCADLRAGVRSCPQSSLAAGDDLSIRVLQPGPEDAQPDTPQRLLGAQAQRERRGHCRACSRTGHLMGGARRTARLNRRRGASQGPACLGCSGWQAPTQPLALALGACTAACEPRRSCSAQNRMHPCLQRVRTREPILARSQPGRRGSLSHLPWTGWVGASAAAGAREHTHTHHTHGQRAPRFATTV